MSGTMQCYVVERPGCLALREPPHPHAGTI